MGQELELELTFLAKELPREIKTVKPTCIIDIYVPDTSKHSHLRLRQKGNNYEITKKLPVTEGDASEQIEQTIPLTKEEFTTLSTCSKKKVIKDRYRMTIEGKIAEIDVFADELKGLVLIDFEFSTENEKSTFKIPDIALADVTQEEFIAGGLLAGKTYDDIAPELERFNYQPIK
ncbi:MAG: hypothetical protein ACFN3A_00275 [Candidatus Nanosyncoccus sp.]